MPIINHNHENINKKHPNYREPIQRFFTHIDMDFGECYLWISNKDKDGYGIFSYNGSNVLAHRYSYEAFVSYIPEGLVIDHVCRNTSCVNPSHLEPVTQRENVLRGYNPASINSKKLYCINGHSLSGKNLYINRKANKRYCRECGRIKSREYARRKSAAKNTPAE